MVYGTRVRFLLQDRGCDTASFSSHARQRELAGFNIASNTVVGHYRARLRPDGALKYRASQMQTMPEIAMATAKPRNRGQPSRLTWKPPAGESCRLFLNTLALYDPHIPVNRNIREFVDLFTRGWPVDFKLIDLGCATDPQYYARIMGR